MSFKTVLAIVGVSTAIADLDNAISLVTDSDVHLSVLAIRPALQPVAVEYPVSTVWIEEREREVAELSKIQLQAEDLCRNSGLSYDVNGLYDDHFTLEGNIRIRALYADVVLIGQSVRTDRDLCKSVIAAVTFDAGTPILLMPATGKISLAPQQVMLAWNSRPEAAKAAKAALDMLKGAASTRIVIVDPDTSYFQNGGEPGADIAAFLARHGVTAIVEQLPSGQRKTEGVLRQHALETGCDMIVMGAYGHSRLRERIFGGVTAAILEDCKVPVFLAR